MPVFQIRLWAAVLLLAAPAWVRAEEPEAVPVAAITVRSCDAVEAWFKKWHLPVPPFLQGAQLSAQFPFVGPEGLKFDAPLGILFLASKELQGSRRMIFMLPAKTPSFFKDQLTASGVQPTKDDPSIFEVKDACFRFTDKNILLGGSVGTLKIFSEELMTAGLKDEAVLARFGVNPKSVRDAAPVLFQSMLDELFKSTGAGFNPAVLKKFLSDGNLDRAVLELRGTENGPALVLHVEPGIKAEIPPFPKPVMPKDCFVRLDWVSPSSKLPDFLAKLPEFLAASAPAEQQEVLLQRLKFVNALRDLLYSGEALSVGLAGDAKDPQLCIIQQLRAKHDLGAAFKQFETLCNALTPEARGKMPALKFETLDEGGTKIYRVSVPMKDQPDHFIYLDLCERPGEGLIQTLCATVSLSAEKHVKDLAALPSEASEIKAGLSGWIDPGGLLAISARVGAPADMGLTPLEFENFVNGLKGQLIRFKFGIEEPALTLELSVPNVVVTTLVDQLARKTTQAPK